MKRQRVICGPTKFHEVDESATRAANTPMLRPLFIDVANGWGQGNGPRLDKKREAERILFAVVDTSTTKSMRRFPHYRLYQIGLAIRDGHHKPGDAIPVCSLVEPGPPVSIEEARARGLDWSLECAKRLGLHPDKRRPLERVDYTGRARAYRHAIDCEICMHQGIAHCEVFPLVATRQIESDVDPKLEQLIA